MSFVADTVGSMRSYYHCNCVDGKCIGCGECCGDILPVTDKEIKRLKQYAKKHNLKEHRHNVFNAELRDCTCPFLDGETHRCDVYAVRPEICRSFICTKTLAEADRDRELLSETREQKSIRYEIFGNDENLSLLLEAKLMFAMFMPGRRI